MSNSEPSLTIRDLVYSILSAWRQIILFSVIGGLLMTGFSFLKAWRSSSRTMLESEVSLTSKEVETATAELWESDPLLLSLNEDKADLTAQAVALQDRIRHSAYLAIDEKAQPLITLTVTVNPEEPGPEAGDSWEQRRYAVILDFARAVKGESFRQYLADANHSLIPATWMGELIDSQLREESYLQVTLTAPDPETVTRLAKAAAGFFQEDIREGVTVFYLYDIQVTAGPLISIQNPQIAEDRMRLADDSERVKLALHAIQDEIGLALEEGLEAKRLEKVDSLISESEGQGGNQGAWVKYALAGVLAGILLALVWAVHRATWKDVIRSGEWWAGQQGLLYLGSLPAGEEKTENKAWGGALDRWLEYHFYLKRDQAIPGSDRMPYLSSVIRGLWRSLPTSSKSEEAGGSLALVGEEAAFATEAFLRFMNAEAEGTDPGKSAPLRAVKVRTQSVEGLELLGKAQAAVIIIRTRKTRQAQALRDLSLIDRMGIPVLGLITLEGPLR